MFDFKLTKKGDLDLDYGSYGTPQKVSFVVGDYEAQRIKFMVTPLVAPNKKPAQQRISFKLADVPETDFTSKNLQDDEELAQAIRLALRTELYDVYDSSIGTRLYQLRHKMVKSEDELQGIADKIGMIVDDLLPGAKTELIAEENSDAGFFRYESYTIAVTYNGKKVADYILL